MPAHDVYHDAVKAALIYDGWTITDEDYTLLVGRQRVFIDIAAERDLIVAHQGNERIAVEVKSFVGPSAVADLRNAIGQYIMYRSILRRLDPNRTPYLAINTVTAQTLFAEPLATFLVEDEQMRILVVDIEAERIVEWRR
jgi:hypothetical protein